ncbi:hypothetical protein JOF53_003468 [Crossiella equi]|uniref:Secreted protein n=1 Tax=Crossiella equi TaxID=130796 RepID=A0ABS5ADE0_9PSEU|nr:hypothetical protein [Crossiella equi]MBP2474596.1 hypothetical protein [Crossiella equi]
MGRSALGLRPVWGLRGLWDLLWLGLLLAVRLALVSVRLTLALPLLARVRLLGLARVLLAQLLRLLRVRHRLRGHRPALLARHRLGVPVPGVSRHGLRGVRLRHRRPRHRGHRLVSLPTLALVRLAGLRSAVTSLHTRYGVRRQDHG